MSQTYDETVEYEVDEHPEDREPLPERPRRRLLTPVTVGLGAVVVGAAGFWGGVEAQKNEQPSATAGGAGGFPGAMAARGGAQGGRGSATAPGVGGPGAAADGSGETPTIGTVANTKGMTIYVTTTDGSTVRVRTKKATEVTRTADSVPRSVRPGDTVVVTGTKNDDGTVTAASVRATQDGVSGGGMMMFPGGGPPSGGAAAQGATAP